MSVEDLDTRLRAVETGYAELKAQVQPLLGLLGAIGTLSNQITELKGELASMRSQAVLLGGIATVVAPVIFAVLLKLMHFM